MSDMPAWDETGWADAPAPGPTWSKPCERCGSITERWPGEGDVSCYRCGAEYNAFGQRLRDDWRGNPSSWDEDVDDMEGFERQQLAAERYDN